MPIANRYSGGCLLDMLGITTYHYTRTGTVQDDKDTRTQGSFLISPDVSIYQLLAFDLDLVHGIRDAQAGVVVDAGVIHEGTFEQALYEERQGNP